MQSTAHRNFFNRDNRYVIFLLVNNLYYDQATCVFFNLCPGRDYMNKPKRYSLPKVAPFLKQKKSILFSTARRDGSGSCQIERYWLLVNRGGGEFFNPCYVRSGYGLAPTVTNSYRTPYTPPIPCARSRKAETTITAVQTVCWGWLGSIRRGIAAVPKLRGHIVTVGASPYPGRTPRQIAPSDKMIT